MAARLSLRDVSLHFGGVKVLQDVSFEVEPGVIFGLVGPNGAGKTSLFNLIAGGVSPAAGTIRLDGKDITHARPHQRCIAGIGRSYQIPQPFETLTVFENLLVGAVYGRGQSERDVTDACGRILDLTHLLPRANVPAGSLSLLERKRLEMARALATGPRLLLLDEIAGGLTEGECQELVETIRSIHADGTTIVWIEHVVHALLAVVGRLVVLNFGRKIAEGHPRTVMNSPEVRQIYMGIEA
jgi:branched-chain amino acid transport system ATP-binding protein